MKDKEIRNILISYLRAQGIEMRIYQEKSIGSSICDLMVVTDCLTGYEIKSDTDNYQRLEGQIKAYNRFFDCNYIVVSSKHKESAFHRVPDSWGIIEIENDSVNVLRKASENRIVSRRSQLSVLWKLELKNLLIKNNMPLFAQKEKGYISDRIVSQVDEKTLGKQIAYELLHRDYSVFDAKDYSIKYEPEYANLPAREIIDALSESNFEELTLDKWIELYKQARNVQDSKQTVFVQKPKEPRVEHKITYKDIEVSLGAPWISETITNEFINHIVEPGNNKAMTHYCEYEPVTGNWHVEYKKDTLFLRYGEREYNVYFKYGTQRYNALKIIEAILNLREIRINYENGKYNEKETVAALEKQAEIEREFKEWIWQDEDRIWEIEEAYNSMFASFENKKYDGSKLKFEGMSENCDLYPYQRDAVQKILESKNTLLAFDVGAGKTYIMIAAAMKMRANGVSRRNMFVVPNHIVGQWEKIFTTLYPQAKVLAIEPKMFKPEMRQKVLRQIKTGDYDGIIIAYSCFEMIPLSESTVEYGNGQYVKAG